MISICVCYGSGPNSFGGNRLSPRRKNFWLMLPYYTPHLKFCNPKPDDFSWNCGNQCIPPDQDRAPWCSQRNGDRAMRTWCSAENRTGTAFQLLLPFGNPRWVDVALTLASWASVLSPFIASTATLNLNSDVQVSRLLLLMMDSQLGCGKS